jgi:hypothetical protein
VAAGAPAAAVVGAADLVVAAVAATKPNRIRH